MTFKTKHLMTSRQARSHLPVRRPELRRCSPASEGAGEDLALGSVGPSQWRFNWRFFLISAALLLLTAGSGVGVHTWQMQRIATGLLERATALESEEQWSEAAGAWHRFLQLKPDHVAAREQLATSFDKAAPQRRARAIELYFEAIGYSPSNLALRNRVTELLLAEGRAGAAVDQAIGALALTPTDPTAQRLLALASYAATRIASRSVDEQTLTRLRAAVAANPTDVGLVLTAAQALREAAEKHPLAGHADEANNLLDQLVAAAPQQPLTWLARSQYRAQYALPGAEQDLAKAQELGPHESVVLLAAAESALRKKDYAAAIALCEQLPQADQAAAGVCRLWGDALLGSGQAPAAIARWRQGLQQPSSGALELQLRLATAALALQDSAAADEALSSLESGLTRWRSQYGAQVPQALDEHVSFLRARWHLLNNDWAQAAPLLRRVALAQTVTKAADTSTTLPPHIEAWLLLAERESQLERWDLAASMLQRAITQDPTNVRLRLLAAQACAQASQWSLALRHAEFALQREPNSPEARLAMAQLQLSSQARVPTADRDLAACDAALAQAEEVMPNEPRLILLRTLRLLMSTEPEQRGQAADLLSSSLDILASQPSYLARAAVMLEYLGRPAAANQAFARLQELAPDAPATKLIAVEIALKRGELDQARADLLAAEPHWSSAQWHQAARLWQRLEALAGQPSAVQAAWERFAAAAPGAMYPRQLLGELALAAKDRQQLNKLVKQLRGLEGEDGAAWRYLAARQMLLEPTLSTHQAAELQSHVEWLVKQRAGWSRTWLLAGLVAEREQDADRAINAYQQVVLLDGAQLPVFERLVALLYRQGRYSEVDRFLAVMSSYGSLSPEASLIAIGSAAAQHDVDAALDLAKKTLAQDPSDVPTTLWLAQLQQMQGRFDEAEQTLTKLLDRVKSDVRVWGGMLALYQATGNRLQFLQTLEQCSAEQQLSPQHRALLLAQGYELLGQPMRAAQHYEQALQHGADATLKLRLAALQLQYDPQVAEATLREIREATPDTATIRRLLAITLAAQRRHDSWQEIETLLANSTSAGDLRLEAMLHLQNGDREELQQAQELLEQLLKTEGKPLAQDRRMLAWLYEQQGNMAGARAQYDALVQESPAVSEHAHAAAAFCLRQQDADGALKYLEALKQQQPIDWTAWHLMAAALDMAQREEELLKLLATLQTQFVDQEKDPEARSQARVQIASILTTLKKSAAADEALRLAVEDSPQAIPGLVGKLLHENRNAEALQAALAGLRRAPSPQLALTLLQAMSAFEAVPAEAEQALAAYLATTDNSQVLLEASNLRLRQDRRNDASELLERVIRLAPDNFLALNNLAALWAEEPDKQTQALAMADRALLSAPRPFAFICDTKAKILLRQGKASEALRELETTVEKWPDAEARIYLHLAFAYQQVGRQDEARTALTTSRARGLKPGDLSPGDRELLEKLDQQLASAARAAGGELSP
jgi:tetratricopeptide (TPR) repeat protein